MSSRGSKRRVGRILQRQGKTVEVSSILLKSVNWVCHFKTSDELPRVARVAYRAAKTFKGSYTAYRVLTTSISRFWLLSLRISSHATAFIVNGAPLKCLPLTNKLYIPRVSNGCPLTASPQTTKQPVGRGAIKPRRTARMGTTPSERVRRYAAPGKKAKGGCVSSSQVLPAWTKLWRHQRRSLPGRRRSAFSERNGNDGRKQLVERSRGILQRSETRTLLFLHAGGGRR